MPLILIDFGFIWGASASLSVQFVWSVRSKPSENIRVCVSLASVPKNKSVDILLKFY